MCQCVISPNVVAGWSCHRCRAYNGLQRSHCKMCGVAHCTPLRPGTQGELFQTYEEAYKDDPEMLARVQERLKAARAAGE